jgi:glucose/arabinose dehydrogenase
MRALVCSCKVQKGKRVRVGIFATLALLCATVGSASPAGADSAAPIVTIIAPTVNQLVTAPVIIHGTVSDDTEVSGVKVAIYRSVAGGQFWNGSAWQISNTVVPVVLSSPHSLSTTWAYQFNAPPGGVFAVAAVATDPTGNIGLTPYQLFAIADSIDPTVTLTTPSANQTFNAKPVAIRGVASDNSAVGDVQIAIFRPIAPNGQFWNGTAWQASYATVTATLAAPGESTTDFTYAFDPPQMGGLFYVAAIAIDTSYRYDLTPFNPFTMPDAIQPTASLTSPTDGSTTTGSFAIAGSATDNNTLNFVGLAIYQAATRQYWNGSGWQAGFATVPANLTNPGSTNSTFVATFSPPAPGYYLIAALVVDGNYNYNITPFNTILAVPPFDPVKVSADFLPDGRLLVAQLSGEVSLVNPVLGTTSNLFTVPGVQYSGASGVLDVSVDPSFATNGRFYVYYGESATQRLRVDRFTFDASAAAMLASQTLIWRNSGPALTGGPANYGHLGGALNFGADGTFYLSVGDNGIPANSQLLTNSFGKVLRFKADGTAPSDNPFYDGAGPNIDEIWAYGLRNPFRGAIDPVTMQYLVTDIGSDYSASAYEEVNEVTRGANFGWPLCEGPITQPKIGPVCPVGVTGPVYSYNHPNGDGRAIMGGQFYRSAAFPPAFSGSFLFADFVTGAFDRLDQSTSPAAATSVATSNLIGGGVPIWIGVGPTDGAIYWLHFSSTGGGQLRRLRYVN